MSFMMPKPPAFNPNAVAQLGRPPPVPVFGKDNLQGAALREKGQKAQAAAFSGSLMGSQLQSANTGGKTLLGQAG
jgi:hypothetical protein